MFRLLSEVARDLSPHLQLIVLDHARLAESWFIDAIAEDWHGPDKLIPESWISPT